MSLPEVLLWKALRARPDGLKFRRQHPMPPYIVDFFCAEAKLAIEIDGAGHDGARALDYDIQRDNRLNARGLSILRIPAEEILKDCDGVVRHILAWAGSPLHRASHGPPPRPGED